MKTLMEIIKSRKSIRAYQDKPLPKQVVKDILEAAKYAPTARNMQELAYRVVTNKDLMDKLSKGIAEALQKEGLPLKGPPGVRPSFFYGAPLLILVIAPKDNNWAATDAALAVQNILLYATSIDLGACFIGMARFIEKDKELCKLVNIPDSRTIAAAVICGYPAENPEPREKKQTAEFFE
ncbi:MAG: nitroreductase family protein [Dehalococcoidales bacterium]|nr:nitroreductase family protein [Dehalococcoidales bacterium]